jgi:hypothetical protein
MTACVRAALTKMITAYGERKTLMVLHVCIDEEL